MVSYPLADYRRAAVDHGEYTRNGDSEEANRAYGDLHEHLKKLIETEDDVRLFELFDDKDIWVQIWAASHTLELDEIKASNRLQTIADAGIPLASMTARYTLQGWKEGSISFR